MLDLETILRSLRDLAREFVSRGAKVFAVFGSVARGIDFIPHRSDVDIFVVVPDEKGFPSRIEIPELRLEISIALYTPRTLEKIVEVVHPILLHLYRASIVYFDDGTLSSILARVPRYIPRSTIEIEKLSTAASLVLGLEKLVLKDFESALDHIHHALRHLARSMIGEGKPVTLFPVYDIEVETVLESRDPRLVKLFNEVKRARAECIASRDTVEKLLLETWNAVSRYLEAKIPSIDKVVEMCGNGRIPDVEIPLFIHREGDEIEIRCGSTIVKP